MVIADAVSRVSQREMPEQLITQIDNSLHQLMNNEENDHYLTLALKPLRSNGERLQKISSVMPFNVAAIERKKGKKFCPQNFLYENR